VLLSVQIFLFIPLALIAALPVVPLGVSIGAYLVIAHLDLSGSGFASAASVGLGNLIKVVVLPTILLMRARWIGSREVIRSRTFWVWVLFVIYVAVAALWSPLPLSALKQVGYLYSYTVFFVLLVGLYRADKRLAYRVLSWSTLAAVGLGFVGYMLGGMRRMGRYTVFSSMQSFGLYLALVAVLVLAFPRRYIVGGVPKWMLLPLLGIALALNGSRTGGVILLGAVLVYGTFYTLRGRFSYGFVMLTVGIVWVGCLLLGILANLTPTQRQMILTENRLLQPVSAILYPQYSFQDIGTFRFRLEMYQVVVGRIQERGNWLWGNGTSSAGDLIAKGIIEYRGYDARTVDANRIVHNEFLRALYEWGIVGLILFGGTLLGIIGISLKNFVTQGRLEVWVVTLAFIGGLVVSMAVENILAGAGTPVGTAVALGMAHMVTLGDR